MKSSKPYLIRAIYEWLLDNECTPYVAIDTTYSQVSVPKDYINEDNTITLDISVDSVKHLVIKNDAMTCQASFGGKVHHIYVPIIAIFAIYAAENSEGMTFPKEEESEYEAYESDDTPTTKPDKPKLRVITNEED